MIRKFHSHKLQTNPWHQEVEPHNNHETPGRQTKQSNQPSLPNQDECKTKIDVKQRTKNIEQLQNPTMGVTINNESTTTEGERGTSPSINGKFTNFKIKIIPLIRTLR